MHIGYVTSFRPYQPKQTLRPPMRVLGQEGKPAVHSSHIDGVPPAMALRRRTDGERPPSSSPSDRLLSLATVASLSSEPAIQQ